VLQVNRKNPPVTEHQLAPCPKYPSDDVALRRHDGALWCPTCQELYHPDFAGFAAALPTAEHEHLHM